MFEETFTLSKVWKKTKIFVKLKTLNFWKRFECKVKMFLNILEGFSILLGSREIFRIN